MIRRIGIAGAVLCCAFVFCAFVAMAQRAAPASIDDAIDGSIDGDWTVTFSIQGQTVPGRMAFHAHGDKLSGTVQTEHTGRGTLLGGAWSHDKLTGICVFEHHEAIALAGELRDGKLAGTFRTEGMNGQWEAVRAGPSH